METTKLPVDSFLVVSDVDRLSPNQVILSFRDVAFVLYVLKRECFFHPSISESKLMYEKFFSTEKETIVNRVMQFFNSLRFNQEIVKSLKENFGYKGDFHYKKRFYHLTELSEILNHLINHIDELNSMPSKFSEVPNLKAIIDAVVAKSTKAFL